MNAVIANGASESAAIDLGAVAAGQGLLGFVIPSAFTGTAVTFQVSADGTNYSALYDSSNAQVSITVAASRAYGFRADVRAVLNGWRWIKLVSNGTEAAERTIPLWVL